MSNKIIQMTDEKGNKLFPTMPIYRESKSVSCAFTTSWKNYASITIPANSFYIAEAALTYNASNPSAVKIGSSNPNDYSNSAYNNASGTTEGNLTHFVTIGETTNSPVTIYAHGKYQNNGTNTGSFNVLIIRKS